MEEKELKVKNIPRDYALCFNEGCKCKDTCMHYLARVLTGQQERFTGQAVYPPPGRKANAVAIARRNR